MSVSPNTEEMKTIKCKTASVLHSKCIEWEIQNFSFLSVGEYISSSRFYVGTEWMIQLYPDGIYKSGYVSVFLENMSAHEVNAELSFSILNHDRDKCHSLKVAKIIPGERGGAGFSKLISREDLLKKENNLLPNDTLTLLCELRVLEALEDSSPYSERNSLDQLSEDFQKLFTSSDSSDITISVANKEFPVHKSILCARSPVFTAMFKNDMKEKRSNVVKIADVDPKVMEKALVYIYTGRCDGIYKMAGELLGVADKYGLCGLKDLCEVALIEQLCSENAADTLIIADLHNKKQLREKCFDYIQQHSKAVLASSSWQKMAVSHPLLELEGLRAIANHNIILK